MILGDFVSLQALVIGSILTERQKSRNRDICVEG